MKKGKVIRVENDIVTIGMNNGPLKKFEDVILDLILFLEIWWKFSRMKIRSL